MFKRIRDSMKDSGLDALIVTSYENVAYLSNAVIITQRFIPTRLAAVIMPLEGEPTLVVCTIEQTHAERDSRIPDIRGYVEFSTSPVETIHDVIQEKGLAKGNLGLEMNHVTAGYFREFNSSLPDATFEPSDKLLDELRMVKRRDEIELLERAALSTDHAIRSAYQSGDVGMTDKNIAVTMANGIQANGADALAFLVMGAGPSAALAHPSPSDRPLEVGDVIRCDTGGYYSGYYSDLARTAVVGKATQEQQTAYHNLWEIHEETIAAARPGVKAQELYFICQAAFERRGITLSLPHIGHSLGLGLHEHPMLSPYNETELQEGTVLAIEPATKLDGGSIIHVEDLVVVTDNVPRILSRSADWSELMVIGG